MQVIYVNSANNRDTILLYYLGKTSLSVYQATGPDEVMMIHQERGVGLVLIPLWHRDLAWKNSISRYNSLKQKFQGKLRFVLIHTESAVTEERMLTLWDDFIRVPERMFEIGATKSFQVDPYIMAELRDSFRLLDKPSEEPADFDLVALQADNKDSFTRVILESKAIREVFDKALLVAPTEANVLITGESGTGKELVAEIIHKYSHRKNEKFLKINCAAISPSLAESEFFGYDKGAFTGAYQTRKGYFEAAHKGTLFLDEISETELPLQGKLLRVIEYGELLRLGSVQPLHIDVRVLAASNRNLLDEVHNGKFRKDLFYRLNVVHIHIPPLRDRKEDLPPLFNYYVKFFNVKHKRDVNKISQKAKRALLNYSWPGNIRELRNTIEGVIVLKQGEEIVFEDLPVEIREAGLPKLDLFKDNMDLKIVPGVSWQRYEKALIEENLRWVHGNRKLCADNLGISERTLYRKIKEYNLES